MLSDTSVPAETYFDSVFRTNAWKAEHSRSGPGSEGVHGNFKFEVVVSVIDALNIRSIIDVGCGDLYWMHRVLRERPDVAYTGVDVSPAVIQHNKEAYPSYTFSTVATFPFETSSADAVVCFDVFGHLLHDEIVSLVAKIRSVRGAKYLITINRKGFALRDPASKNRLCGIDLTLAGYMPYAPYFEAISTLPGDWIAIYKL